MDRAFVKVEEQKHSIQLISTMIFTCEHDIRLCLHSARIDGTDKNAIGSMKFRCEWAKKVVRASLFSGRGSWSIVKYFLR